MYTLMSGGPIGYYVCMYACMYVCMYVCVLIYVYICMCMYASMYVCNACKFEKALRVGNCVGKS